MSLSLQVSLAESSLLAVTYSLLGEGYWKGGKFTFEVAVPEEYNNKVSQHNA